MTTYFRRNAICTIFMLLLSSLAVAHPGHDHSHWSSDALHILFYGVTALTIALGGLWIVKAKNKNSQKEEK